MTLRRAAEFLWASWLLVMAADYFGLIELPGTLADLAAATLLIVIATMIWKHLIRREKAHG